MDCSLAEGDLLRLEGGAKGLTLHCLKGTIWLTKGDGVDYLAHEGRCFRLAAGGTAVAEALGAAEIRLEAAACDGIGLRPRLAQVPCRTFG